jgi:hypothetical protein
MHHSSILNVAASANHDSINVAAQDRLIPNAAFITEGDVAQDGRVACNETSDWHFGLDPEMLGDARIERHVTALPRCGGKATAKPHKHRVSAPALPKTH